MSLFENLLCPIDGAPLVQRERCLICEHGHSYDLAKTGYVNLLPVQNKRSKDPGDSKEMVASRQAFLSLGHYEAIAQAIHRSLPSDLKAGDNLRILDAGCGEGYYLEQLGRALLAQQIDSERLGIDISKWAVMAASKRDKGVTWLVASNAALPMPKARVDAVLCLFGFPMFEEFSRVLSEQGYLLLVESGADHLIELREILYPKINQYKTTYADGIANFNLLTEQSVRFQFDLSSQQQIRQLLSMTPHMHKSSYEGRQALSKLNAISLTADVKLRWYQKNS
ncbi:methyltransferase domain-containing protein [Marinomonas epiphytica]